MEPGLLSERARFWGLLGFWDTTDIANQPLHRLRGDYKDKWFLGLLIRLITFDVPGLANSVSVRITVAIRSNELNDMKRAMRSELQTLSLLAVLLATVGIAPFAAPPNELVHAAQFSQPTSQMEVEENLLFGGVPHYRIAYAACWTLSLLFNGTVVLLSTLLLLSLPHLTHDAPKLHRRSFCFLIAVSIAILLLGLLCFLCGCLITVEFLYRSKVLSSTLFFSSAVVVLSLTILWFSKISDYVCGGARQVHYLAQYYAMRHYYLEKLVNEALEEPVDIDVEDVGQDLGIQLCNSPIQVKPALDLDSDAVDNQKQYPRDNQIDRGELQWEEYSFYEEGFKADSSRFSVREKALAFEIAQERLKGLLRNLEVSERRVTHLKYELACFNQVTALSDTEPSAKEQYKHHWPQDKGGAQYYCRDVEHAVSSAKISFLGKELEHETSRLLLLRRVIDVQYAALKMMEKLEDIDLALEERMWYKKRMITFVQGSCSICIKPAREKIG